MEADSGRVEEVLLANSGMSARFALATLLLLLETVTFYGGGNTVKNGFTKELTVSA